MKVAMVQFEDKEPFLRRAQDDLSPATCSKPLGIVSGQTKSAYLKMELAAVVDGGECLVKATHKLEGDRPLALCAYELVKTIRASVRVLHFPNVHAIARKMGPGNPTGHQQWVAYGLQCVPPGLDYLHVHKVFATSLKDAFATFKAVRLFSPQRLQEIAIS